MTKSIGFLLTIVSVIATCRALPDIHKQMSPQQLQSVFHVDSIHSVPQYEVVQLLHHKLPEESIATPHYRRRRRSINVILPNADPSSVKESHHVKKDLSKNPTYSEIKETLSSSEHLALNPNSLVPDILNKIKDHNKNIDLKQIKEHKVSFNAFGENLNLTLLPTQGLFKESPHKLRMWTMNNEPNATHGLNIQEVLEEDPMDSVNIGEVFQDEKNMAAILMRKHLETGDLIMEGSIGHDLVITPLPHDLSPNKNEAHHIIYKREASQMDHLSDFAFMEPDDIAASENLEQLQRLQRHRRSAASLVYDENEELVKKYSEDSVESVDVDDENPSRTRSKRQAPYIIYPEILVIVDYDGYRLHGGDNLQVKRYFISFWNGVDLRYRLLKGPRIRISIAGIIISRGRDATPYLERNRVGRDAIDSAAALTDMGKYLFRERRLPVYDIAVAITKLDMCRRATAYGECNRGTAGFAYVGGACVVNKRLEKVNSVAIIEDTGGFSGIIVAAHEVGHLLGAVHDGSPPPSYLGGPGAQRCRWEDGYIMSDLRHTERGFRWSPCTVQSFHHFLNGDTATCLHNAPHEDSALGRSLPGTLLSLDAQCRRDRGTYACFKDERVCAQLFCFDAQTGYCVAYRPAAEGSSCGNGMHCLDGRCAALPSNNIPDYGHYRLAYNSTKTNGQDLAKDNAQIDDTENDAAVNVEQNEAIQKPKSKFIAQHISTTQQQLQSQPNHLQNDAQTFKTTASTVTTATATQPTRSSFIFGGRSSTSKPQHYYYDTYLKKLHDLHLSSTTPQSKSTSSTISPTTIKQPQQHHNPYGNFLKRTHITTSSSTNQKGSNNNQKKSNRNENSSSSSGSSSTSNLQHSTTLSPQQQFNYLSNYIGDNTNHSPKILINVVDEQEQPEQTITSASAQPQSLKTAITSSTTTQQKQQSPKYKVQKLIRRQYRRTQVK